MHHITLFLKIASFSKTFETNTKRKKTFLRTWHVFFFFFFFLTQALIGKNSYYIPFLFFSRLSSRWPVFVCLYLWCGSETGLLLATGRYRDAALGTRSCLRWVLLLAGLCLWHAYCNPALGKPTNSISHSGLRPTTDQFCHATLRFGQSRPPNGHSMTLDLQDDSISHQRIWDTESQLQAWPSRH